MNKNFSAKNGKKGGRPSSSSYNNTFVIPNINLVILTERQYKVLVKRYGLTLISHALSILDYWLKTSQLAIKYRGKNNYAHFRSDGWVINEARLTSTQQI